MPTYEHTLLDQTCKVAVRSRSSMARSAACVGISESGYNAIDIHLNYQYRAFGVPGLGSCGGCRGPGHCPVCFSAGADVAPEEACLNLEQLTAAGMRKIRLL